MPPIVYSNTASWGPQWTPISAAGTTNVTFTTTAGTTATLGNARVYMAPVNQRPTVWPTYSRSYEAVQSPRIPELTEEQRAAARESEEQAERRRREAQMQRRREEQAANYRARELLMMHLTPAQREEFEAENRFHVAKDGVLYRITKGWSGNIYVIEDGSAVEVLCIHTRERMPLEDLMLLQKLMIESGDPEFQRANRTRLRPRSGTMTTRNPVTVEVTEEAAEDAA